VARIAGIQECRLGSRACAGWSVGGARGGRIHEIHAECRRAVAHQRGGVRTDRRTGARNASGAFTCEGSLTSETPGWPTSLNPLQAVAPSAAAAPDPSSAASCALASVFPISLARRDDAVVHPLCAAYKRPEPVLEALAGASGSVPDREGLERTAVGSAANKRLQRIDGAERSPSGKANCRSCHQPSRWEVGVSASYSTKKVVSHPEDACTSLVAGPTSRPTRSLNQVLQFSPDLSDADREELIRAFDAEQADPSSDQRTATPPDEPRGRLISSANFDHCSYIQLPRFVLFFPK